jgi:hypothetical protein
MMRSFPLPILLLIVCSWWQQGLGQNNDATAFYNKAMATIKPTYKNLVSQAATQMKGRRINQDSLTRAFASNKSLKGLNEMDIEALVELVMMQMSHDAQSDLNNMVAEMRANNQQKQAQRSMLSSMKVQPVKKDSFSKTAIKNKQGQLSDKKDSMADMNQMDQLRMQQIMEKKSKLEEIISNIQKKISDTSDQIISNLK